MLAWAFTSADLDPTTWWGVLVLAFTLLPLLPFAVSGIALVRDLDGDAGPATDTRSLHQGFHAHGTYGATSVH